MRTLFKSCYYDCVHKLALCQVFIKRTWYGMVLVRTNAWSSECLCGRWDNHDPDVQPRWRTSHRSAGAHMANHCSNTPCLNIVTAQSALMFRHAFHTFKVPRFPVPRFLAPVRWSHVFQSCVFHPCVLVPTFPVPRFTVPRFQRPH